MPDVYSALAWIAASRKDDPLRPVTFITPSHASGLQLRRILASHSPFAAVRFETLPRLAELMAGGRLAAQARAPLARPIGDYLAQVVAAESGEQFGSVRDLPGYARTLRVVFTRLKRAGVRSSIDIRASTGADLREVLRLFDKFAARSAGFYDMEDLQDEAARACREGSSGVREDIGDVYVVPPGAETDAGNELLAALDATGTRVTFLDDPSAASNQAFTIVPDPATEAREVARGVLADIESGRPLDEIAVFHGADRTYGPLLREAFEVAGIPAVPLPGIPLIETRAGRGVLLLAGLPKADYARTSVMEFLGVSPLKQYLPAADGGSVTSAVSAWDQVSRNAGITHATQIWDKRLSAAIAQGEAEIGRLDEVQDDKRIAAIRFATDQAQAIQDVVQTLARRMDALADNQPASTLIDTFKQIVKDYFAPGDEELDDVFGEIDQLGTIGAVGGSFTLDSFAEALRANLAIAYRRPVRMGSGVVIADYRAAAGMRFRSVHLAGAYEGAFPAGPGIDSILDDRTWRTLKEQFPHTEDAATRIDRAKAAATRATAAASNGNVSWSAPAHQPGGTRDYYPAPPMVIAYAETTREALTASDLRSGIVAGPVRRLASPLIASLTGAPLDAAELAVRQAVVDRQGGRSVDDSHPRRGAVDMLRARWSDRFTEYDGNISLGAEGVVALPTHVSPTTLEDYATCGFRYFGKKVLRLKVLEEPSENDTMAATTRGSLVHDTLEEFFRGQQALGRPKVGEFWTDADTVGLLEIARRRFQEAKDRGEAGYDLYAIHDLRTIEADLARFLLEDNEFRLESGAVPSGFEVEVPEGEIAGMLMRGRVDRIDRTPDGTKAWVIDYKTGSAYGVKDMKPTDPLVGGTKLQLPWYTAAAAASSQVTALYWFITQKGEFKKVEYPQTPGGEDRFRNTVASIVEGISAGIFPAVSGDEDSWRGSFENCSFCDFTRICSTRRDIAFDDKRSAPAMAHWTAIADAARAGLQS